MLISNRRGQFIPISAMVMFTIMVFLFAVVNVYHVARTKLKVQNLADAAALNLASQEAQSYNVVTDRNEWMNHMTAGIASPSDPNAPANVKDCSVFNMGHPNNLLIPPVTCVENTLDPHSTTVFSRRVWDARGNPGTATDGAIGYAMLVHTINVAQKLFVQAYNSFLGVGGGVGQGNINATTNFEDLLKTDIPDLDPAVNPNIHLVAWNSGQPSQQQLTNMTQPKGSPNFNSTMMRGLNFNVDHDISTRYQTNKSIESTTLSGLLFGKVNYGTNSQMKGPLFGQTPESVGWMVPGEQPTISIQKQQGGESQIGVGVYVSETIQLPIIGSLSVGAQSKAYLVKGSGVMGDQGGIPVFRPTYWVKLAS